MRALREALGGLSLAAITACTVLGGILLAVSETRSAVPLATFATQTAPASAPTIQATLTLTSGVIPSAATRRPKLSQTPTFAVQTLQATSLPPPAVQTLQATSLPPPAVQTLQATSLPPPAAPSNTSAPPTLAVAPSLTPTVCAPPGGWVAYTIQPGDTLFRIGLRYGLTVTELERANCLAGDSIKSGQRILVPPLPTSAAPTRPAATSAPTAVPAPLRITNITIFKVVYDAARPPQGAVVYLKIEFAGGLPPFSFYDEGIRQLDNPIQALTDCGATVIHTARVDSADGQSASKSYYFSPIVCP